MFIRQNLEKMSNTTVFIRQISSKISNTTLFIRHIFLKSLISLNIILFQDIYYLLIEIHLGFLKIFVFYL